MHIIKPGTSIDFVGKRKIAAVFSLITVVASMLLFFVKGPNWGIDFTGGTEIELHFEQPTRIDEVRGALVQLGLSEDAVQQVGSDERSQYIVRIQDTTFGTEGLRTQVEDTLRAKYGPDFIEESVFDAQVGARMRVRYRGMDRDEAELGEALAAIPGVKVGDSPDENTVEVNLPGVTEEVTKTIEAVFPGRGVVTDRVDAVGPKVGGDLRSKGALALLATMGLILVYVGFRFDVTFAPGAVIALLHDVAITVGIFVLTRHEFNLSIVGALLTIVGYSINDTIIIYDRVRENMRRYRRADMERLINDSVNETLGRTFATSFTTLIAMVAFMFLGGPVIQTFSIAICIGVFVGTYSTVYVAAPTILVMQDLKPWLERLASPLAAGMQKIESAATAEQPAPAAAPVAAAPTSLVKAAPAAPSLSKTAAPVAPAAAPAVTPDAAAPDVAPPAPAAPTVSESARRRAERKRLREAAGGADSSPRGDSE
ncbi:MAG: protein translocase subunit SecF [Deltaproteobacteria bacterium]|nr:protein translocase subunit SecF [Deltaproteobacteria bacterium]